MLLYSDKLDLFSETPEKDPLQLLFPEIRKIGETEKQIT